MAYLCLSFRVSKGNGRNIRQLRKHFFILRKKPLYNIFIMIPFSMLFSTFKLRNFDDLGIMPQIIRLSISVVSEQNRANSI